MFKDHHESSLPTSLAARTLTVPGATAAEGKRWTDLQDRAAELARDDWLMTLINGA